MGRSTLDFNMQGLLVVCLTVVVGLASGQEEGNTVGAIPGQAGRDYPNFQEIPESSFSCRDLSPGFYADPEGECQVYPWQRRSQLHSALPNWNSLQPAVLCLRLVVQRGLQHSDRLLRSQRRQSDCCSRGWKMIRCISLSYLVDLFL